MALISWRWDALALSESNGGSNQQPYGFGNINSYSMQVSSSVNLFGRKRINSVTTDANGAVISKNIDTEQKTNVWVIQPKMEVPILNVHGAAASIPIYHSESVPRSIWNQFGSIPKEDEGVYLEVSDIEESWLKNRVPLFYGEGPNAVEITLKDSDGFFPGQQNATAVSSRPLFSTYGGIANASNDFRMGSVESLVDQLGFKNKSQKLGQLAKHRKVKEAIVAVPFLEIGGKREFFEIPKKDIETSLSLIEKGSEETNSVIEMLAKMKDYVFPPKFDFIKNIDIVTPFAMYIFEFEHVFDQNDLSYIWQGIQPLSGKSMQLSEASVEHRLLSKELMGKAIDETGEKLQTEIRWMVFKVKQRASTDYYEKIVRNEDNNPSTGTGETIGRATINDNGQPEYSYNWPYDYFSLVEFAKIEAEVELAPDKSGTPSDSDDTPVIREKEPCEEIVGQVVELGLNQISEDLLK